MGLHVPETIFRTSPAKKRHILSLDPEKYARSIVAYTPNEKIIAHLVGAATPYISTIAALETVLRVFRHNPDTICAFSRGAWTDEVTNQPLGFLCHLPLNAEGHEALFDGRLDTRDPALRYIARPNQRPAAIYLWGLYLTPQVAGGLALAMERLTSDRYRGLPIYLRSANPTAYAFFRSLGFKEGASFNGKVNPSIMSCERPDPFAQRPLYDTFDPSVPRTSRRVGITVAHSMAELLKVMAIRAATYIEDQAIPYDEDVDGNDFCASHLLGHIGLEPAGCLRIRYFADFVKFERLAVLPRYRGKLALQLIRAGIAFAQAKGYRRFYGHAAEDVAPIWRRFGFVQRPTEGTQFLTDQTYYEFDMELPEPLERLTPASGPVVLVRPEGQWDRPCSFERTGPDT